jgi:hypothetical protein
MVASLHHWLPLVNGHTGFVPWAYRAMTPEFARLPERDALQALVDLTGLGWILVRRGRVPETHFAAWERFARTDGSVRREPAGDPDLLLRVTLGPRRDWANALVRTPPPPGLTALGTPLAPLDEADVRGRLTASVSPRVPAAAKTVVAIRIENLGSQTWPALIPPGTPETGAVRLHLRWRAAGGAVVLETSRAVPRDVAPDDVLRFGVAADVPRTPGVYTLEASVAQVGGAPMHGVVSDPVAVAVTEPVPPAT